MTGDLKRIGFVKAYATTATNIAGSAYATAKTFVPKQLAGTVESTEALVVSKATPIATWAIGKGEAVLSVVDAQVDSTVNALAGSLSFSRELHAKNMAAFAEAKAEYFKYVEAGVSALSRAANPLPYATAAADALRAALDKAVTVADPDLAVDTVHEAWTRVSAHPLVAKALGIVGPTATTVAAHYSAAHDTVVATPAYKAGYGKVGAALAAAQEGALYRRAKALVYPLVAPVADPLAANFARSRVVKQLAEHIKPQMP